MSKRDYNPKVYGVVKKANGVLRDKLSHDVGAPFKLLGLMGNILCWIVNKIIVKPIRFFAFTITGLFYDKKRNKPYKGSFIYTVCFILFMCFAANLVKAII